MTADLKPMSLRLHLGCFDQPREGWVNTDITPHIWIARVPLLASALYRSGRMTRERWQQHHQGIFKKVRYLDVTRRFPYPDNTFEAVFSCHLLEHLYPDQARSCIAETLRILKAAGICRIVVPDLDKMVRDYHPDDPQPFLRAIFECADRGTQKNLHHWHYNEKSLVSLLLSAGFRHAYRCEYHQGSCPDLEILDNRPESLFVEAQKQ